MLMLSFLAQWNQGLKTAKNVLRQTVLIRIPVDFFRLKKFGWFG